MLSEEEMRAIDFLKGVCTDDCVNKEFVVKPILYLIENQQKELNNLKEIEQAHKEENGKLRVEFEKVYEDNSPYGCRSGRSAVIRILRGFPHA
jgi:hypothetical protein